MPGRALRVVRGQAPPKLDRDAFGERFRARFADPAFDAARAEIERLEAIAWGAYHEGWKAPRTAKAGPGYADPTYDLSTEWRETKARIDDALGARTAATTPRVLVIVGSARNDGSCPSEASKTFRLAGLAREVLERRGIEVDPLDLSELTSGYDRHIHPCKACVSTAMPLCHWPCSCYPNHGLGQVNDAMAGIYERWARADGVVIVTPVYWYQSPSPLKLMIDRLVCADGGNPDPSSTHGKKPEEAKRLELDGWGYPQHLAGRVFGVVVHGDAEGTEDLRRSLVDWLASMGLVGAGAQSHVDRYIGYYEPYATSHDALDRDEAVQGEVRNVAAAVANAVREAKAGTLSRPDGELSPPRKK